MHQAKGAVQRGRPRPRPITDEQRAALLVVEGDARDAMVRELQAAGVSSRSLGAVLGVPDWQMSDRYPRA